MQGEVDFRGWQSTKVAEFASGSALFSALANGGKWFVVADFEGRLRGWRFENVAASVEKQGINSWQLPDTAAWRSSLTQSAYEAAVSRTRAYISNGDVYQANICRVLSAQLADPQSPALLAKQLQLRNPAPFQGFIHVTGAEEQSVWLASASPESYLRISRQPDGTATVTSSPIKGTARDAAGITDKDRAENIMITDLMRNDISQITTPGSVAVRNFLELEEHPGLVHLVSTVTGTIPAPAVADAKYWERIFAATFPPGSVSGAPKKAALEIIADLETHKRGPYCGGFGWIDADTGACDLAVGIRSFWWDADCADCAGPALHFGTGAGITWGSDPTREWQETQLKAARLIAIAGGTQ